MFDLAARSSVSDACRTFDIYRCTYYAWKPRVERRGLEILRPRERRRPRMPNQLSPFVEQRIVAVCARPSWSGTQAAHGDRRPFLLRLGGARHCPRGNPTGEQTSKLARRVAQELQTAGWRLERVLSHNGGEYRSRSFAATLAQLGARHTLIRAGRPQTNGAVESLHRTILEECWRPAFARYLHVRFTGLRRDLARDVDYYNNDTRAV